MRPVFVVARFPAAMRGDEDAYSGGADCGIDRLQVLDQPDVLGDRLDPVPDLAAFRKEVVIGVDKEQGCRLFAVIRL